jgi:transposase
MSFKYNITKECEECGEPYLVDILDNKHKEICDICNDRMNDTLGYERRTLRYELSLDLNPTGLEQKHTF